MILSLADQSMKTYVSQLSVSQKEAFVLDSIDYFVASMIAVFVAHFGERGNRAKWMATATFLTGLSAISFAVPYFNYEIIKLSLVRTENYENKIELKRTWSMGLTLLSQVIPYHVQAFTGMLSLVLTRNEEKDLCYEGKKPRVCEITVIPHKSICVGFFAVGQLLHGIAGIQLILLSMTFISDHVPTVSSTADASVIVGYLLGFLLAIKSFKLPVKEAMKATGIQKIRLEKSQEPSTVDRRLINKEIKNNLKSVLHAIWVFSEEPAGDDPDILQNHGVYGCEDICCICTPIFTNSIFNNANVLFFAHSDDYDGFEKAYYNLRSVPGPIYFGKISGLSCSFWDINACGMKVRCWIYNKEKLFNTFVGTWTSLQLGTCLVCLYAISRYDYVVKGKPKRLEKPAKVEESEDEDEEVEKKTNF
ncbi:Solute carrier organic anion transporter family, member 6d1 [Apodemus speciosus]|uniref:Solute carrier organic anion transporter family, member 6d1 n=1 Tax=Apodemus speciosus TaxID=105296 RepID=A0ABQ0EET5_APOSI